MVEFYLLGQAHLKGEIIFNFRRQYQEILIGDTHPEMIAIACELSKQQHEFKLFLPLYFTHREAQIVKILVWKNLKFRSWLYKRTLPIELRKRNLIRPFASIDFFLWVLKRLDLSDFSDKLLKIYKVLLQSYLSFYLRAYPSATVICYDTIKIPNQIMNRIIAICPMTHPETVRRDLRQAKLDYPDWPISSKIEDTGILATSARADILILLSTYARDSFKEAGFNSEKLSVLPIGPINGRPETFEMKRRSKQNLLQLLFVGHMGLRKGVPALLELSYKIRSIGKLRLVGPCSREVADYIKENSDSQTLTLVQNPTPDALIEEFTQADVFLMPSYNEGFGIACVEGMSFGQIPILSVKTGVSEVLIGSVLERFLIRPGSYEDILKNLEYIAKLDEDEYHSLRIESQRISKLSTFESFAKRFVHQFC